MDNIKFNFRIKYESEKAAEEMKKALKRSSYKMQIFAQFNLKQ